MEERVAVPPKIKYRVQFQNWRMRPKPCLGGGGKIRVVQGCGWPSGIAREPGSGATSTSTHAEYGLSDWLGDRRHGLK